MSSSLRPSRFLDLVMLRSRHSWTSWRQRVATRRLHKEMRRLILAREMLLLQQERVDLLRLQSLPPVTPSPSVPVFNPSPGLSLVQQEMQPLVEKELQTLAALEPTEDDLLLGLVPPPTSSPSSGS